VVLPTAPPGGEIMRLQRSPDPMRIFHFPYVFDGILALDGLLYHPPAGAEPTTSSPLFLAMTEINAITAANAATYAITFVVVFNGGAQLSGGLFG